MAAPAAKAELVRVNGALDTAASDGAADGGDAAGDACDADGPAGEAPVEPDTGVATPPGLPEPLAPEHATTVVARKRSAMARCDGDRMRPVSTACHERGLGVPG
jgi:hypothetical protein